MPIFVALRHTPVTGKLYWRKAAKKRRLTKLQRKRLQARLRRLAKKHKSASKKLLVTHYAKRHYVIHEPRTVRVFGKRTHVVHKLVSHGYRRVHRIISLHA